MDKSKLVDDRGRPLSQSLFLEIGYTDFAVFTFRDEDYEYKGKTYTSLKKLYLAFEDPIEYDFAVKYLVGWQQWKKLQGNRQVMKHIEEWREELDFKMRSQAIKDIMDMSAEGKSYQASKLLLDKGWDKRAVGRPNEQEAKREARIKDKLDDEFSADITRLKSV